MKLINHKLILVIGGTGAQGQAVVKALVEPSSDGAPSSYSVRILTRNPDHPKVKAEFNHPNIELMQGSFTDLARVERACEGVWGAYINTDGFTVGEQAEKGLVVSQSRIFGSVHIVCRELGRLS